MECAMADDITGPAKRALRVQREAAVEARAMDSVEPAVLVPGPGERYQQEFGVDGVVTTTIVKRRGFETPVRKIEPVDQRGVRVDSAELQSSAWISSSGQTGIGKIPSRLKQFVAYEDDARPRCYQRVPIIG